MSQSKDQVVQIREVFTYAERFHGKTFVVQLANTVIDDPLFPTLVQDLITLFRAGIRILLVPGAHEKIDEILDVYGVSCSFSRGVRISSPDAMPFIKMAAFDVSNRVMSMLSAYDVNAVIGNWVRARSRGVIDGVDFLETGVVEKIKNKNLARVLEDGFIPIFPCIGWNSQGRPYNLSSRELASELAQQLQADKLFFITDLSSFEIEEFRIPEDAVLNEQNRISRMSVKTTEQFIQFNSQRDGQVLYDLMRVGLDACQGGVKRVHLLEGREEGAILKEVFSSFGSGIMIYSNEFESIRNMRIGDVPAVLRIMNPLIEQKILIPRSKSTLTEQYADYVVYETDGVVYGCGALHRFKDNVGEIAAIAVDSRHARLGIGQRLVSFLVIKAGREGFRQLFVLTTQASDWFDRMGFTAGSRNDLPEEKRLSISEDRNSRALFLDL